MIHQLLPLTRPLFTLDTETTGVNTKIDRIVEIGFEQWGSEGFIKSWVSLVNPTIPIPLAASKIHNIYDLDMGRCQECKLVIDDVAPDRCQCETPRRVFTFAQLAPSLARGLSDCDFAGKNVRFDLRIIAAEMARAGQVWDYSGARIIDAERLEQLAVPRSLSHLHEKYVRKQCEECGGKGMVLDAPGNVLDGRSYETKCEECKGLGTIGVKHDGAHGALSDVQASTTVIAHQLQVHEQLPRDLDQLHKLQWKDQLVEDGSFRMVNGVPTCMFGKKWRNHAMKDIPSSFWDWMLSNDFPADVKKLVANAKLGIFPEAEEA